MSPFRVEVNTILSPLGETVGSATSVSQNEAHLTASIGKPATKIS